MTTADVEPPAGRRLHNADWGVDSNCFVCEPANDAGLRIPFYADSSAGRVTARFNLAGAFSGAPSFVHGGVTLAILDEAQAWAVIALVGKFAVTTETTSRFRRPVIVGQTYEVRAWITDVGDERVLTEAEVRDADEEVCATTTATFFLISEATARTASGGEVSAEMRDFLR